MLIAAVALLVPWWFVRELVVGVGATVLSMIDCLVLALSEPRARDGCDSRDVDCEPTAATPQTRLAGDQRLLLPGRDVDHLLISPGGVVVIETKW
jgi:hypothetical protein